jgi:hypothetical protein
MPFPGNRPRIASDCMGSHRSQPFSSGLFVIGNLLIKLKASTADTAISAKRLYMGVYMKATRAVDPSVPPPQAA